MTRTRRSALWLVLAGLLAGLFFWLTDPRWGVAGRAVARWNLVDAANQALPGTLIGLAGSAVLLAIGGWLMTRRRT